MSGEFTFLGSGISRAAGISTGWEILKDQIEQVAALQKMPNDIERRIDHQVDPAGYFCLFPHLHPFFNAWKNAAQYGSFS